mgnify:CR=1 FL=1
MNSHFDSFTHFAKNTFILAQEEMGKLTDNQIQTQYLLLGILRQPKSLGGVILRNFGVNYENAYRIAEDLRGPNKDKEKMENDLSSNYTRNHTVCKHWGYLSSKAMA